MCFHAIPRDVASRIVVSLGTYARALFLEMPTQGEVGFILLEVSDDGRYQPAFYAVSLTRSGILHAGDCMQEVLM